MSKPQPKVSVIGAGNVGATAAQRIAEKDIADVALVDVAAGTASGKALDLIEAAPLEGHDRLIAGGGGYEITAGSDVVVITAGLPRKPGMTREDLLHKNAAIIRDVCRQVLPHSPEATFVVVSNPLDVMTQLTKEVTDLPAQRVVGMAGVLDTTRMRFFIAEALGVSMEDVVACVLGGHGDSMVPLPRYCSVSGIPIDRLMSEHDIDAIVERTRKGGAEVVDHLQTGSAFYAPASSACQMVEAIVRDKKRVLPCCCYLEGQYGLRDVYVGVPAKLSGQGVETIYELELTSDELSQLTASAEIVRENVRKLQDEAASNNS